MLILCGKLLPLSIFLKDERMMWRGMYVMVIVTVSDACREAGRSSGSVSAAGEAFAALTLLKSQGRWNRVCSDDQSWHAPQSFVPIAAHHALRVFDLA